MTLPSLLLFSFVAAAAPAGQTPPATLSATRTQLLGGHLTIALPQGMKVEDRQTDIMSAPAADQDETRAVLDVGTARLVMMVSERYATAPKEAREAIQADLLKGFPKSKLEELPLAPPLRGYGAAVTLPEVREANLIYLAYLIHADTSIQMIGFYVNPEGAKHAAAWTALARKITASALAGARQLDTKGGARALGPLRITLPEGWVTHTQPGPDFAVYRLSKLTPLGSRPSSCGIYLGGYPSFQFRQAGIDPALTRQVKGTLLGGATEWVVWSRDGRSETEAMAGHKGQKVHVFCDAGAEAELAGLRQIAASLRWK